MLRRFRCVESCPQTVLLVSPTTTRTESSGRPGGSVWSPRNLLTLGREFESWCSHTNWDFSSQKYLCYVYVQQAESDLFVGTQNTISRSTRERDGWILLAIKIKASTAEGTWKNPARSSFCVTLAGTSTNKPYVQNKWNGSTHTYRVIVPL